LQAGGIRIVSEGRYGMTTLTDRDGKILCNVTAVTIEIAKGQPVKAHLTVVLPGLDIRVSRRTSLWKRRRANAPFQSSGWLPSP